MPTIALLLAALLLSAAPVEAQSRSAVVELFTSEGCSSCPPAEALISQLARDGVVALTLHIDYWDDLGWRDRFALPEALQRQRQYARTLRLSSVYTPQVVVDGLRDIVGSDQPGIARAVSSARAGVPIEVFVQANSLLIKIGAQPRAGLHDVVLLPYLAEAHSKISRGENAGRDLHEFNIVRALRKLGDWSGAAQTFSLPLSALPADATDVAVLLQAAGQGAIAGAAVHALR